MTGMLPSMWIKIGGVHIHHFVWGILILVTMGAYQMYWQPLPWSRAGRIMPYFYGAAIGLIFDEFDMWLHLGGTYNSQMSFDIVVSIVLVLLVIIGIVKLQKYGVDTVKETLIAAIALLIVASVILIGIHRFHKQVLHKKMQTIEQNAKY